MTKRCRRRSKGNVEWLSVRTVQCVMTTTMTMMVWRRSSECKHQTNDCCILFLEFLMVSEGFVEKLKPTRNVNTENVD